MKNFHWFRQISNKKTSADDDHHQQQRNSSQTHDRRRVSLTEYRRAVSWSKYLVSSGGEIKGATGGTIGNCCREEEDQIGGGEEEDRIGGGGGGMSIGPPGGGGGGIGNRSTSEWSADMSQLYIGNKFATGRHSRVYKGIYKNKDVAIKLVSQPEEDAGLANLLESQFNSEVDLLFRLDHANIIKFVAACKKPPVFCIITEYLPGGSLRKFLHQYEPHSVPLNLGLKLALDIARGMDYLHSEGILHRDLKSENLLLDENMAVKVADFGISCLESEIGSPKGFTGTYRWMAPEMIKEKQHTKKVDVYSFGIVLWELLTALIPFDDMTPEQAAFAVCQKNARPPLPSHCPAALTSLISRCWSSKPNKRPQFDEIVKVLESYIECLEQDPDFFFVYEPCQRHHRRLLRCLPKCIADCKSA